MTHANVKAAARAAGVSYRTLRTWLQDPRFKDELQHAQAEAIAGTVRALTTVMGDSVGVLARLLKSKTASIRLGAVRTALGDTPGLVELGDLEERLQRLEQQQHEP